MISRFMWTVFAMLAMGPYVASADDPTAYFEAHVRPLLIRHCYECHSSESKQLEGGLYLDSKPGWEKGGDSGPALVPGKPDESLLVQAIRYTGDASDMPPGGKLPEHEIKRLTEWVAMGAPDPRTEATETARPSAIDWDAAKEYWAFQPLQVAGVPEVRQRGGLNNPVDAFIRSRLESEGLSPSIEAPARTLIRRATLDVTGMPPTPEEVDQFLADARTDRYDRLVDRLLASPALGERWARHWLDVARFAESFGFEHDYDRPFAYHFRDFVIRAMNDDLPFETFVRWQIAGDEEAPEEPLAMMATGFLGAGVFPTQITANEVERTRYDALDDMLATVGSGMLGLSIGCARCHDHKFDPIPSDDYYRMLDSFTTTVRSEIEIDLEPERTRQAIEHWAGKQEQLEASVNDYERTKLPARLSAWLSKKPTALARISGWVAAESVRVVSEGGANYQAVGDGSFLATGPNPDHDVVTISATTSGEQLSAIRIEALSDPSLPKGGPGRADNGNIGLTKIEAVWAPADQPDERSPIPLTRPRATFEQKGLTADSTLAEQGGCWAVDPRFGQDHAIAYDLVEPIDHDGPVIVEVRLTFACNTRHTIGRPRLTFAVGGRSLAPADKTISRSLAEAVQQIQSGKPWDELSDEGRQALIQWYRYWDLGWQQLERERARHAKDRPVPELTKVMVASEGFTPIRWHSQGADFFEETYFLKRGDPNLKGPVATQSFLRALMRSTDDPSRWQESPPAGARTSYRRTALAHWLTDEEGGAGDLAARVMVNRLWQHHLGRGIVSTPNDFGVQGEPPSHPELLDWLAHELSAQDGSLKSLHRLILTSATYRQSSEIDSTSFSADPDNRLVWRFTPRRLEAESIRDSLLAVSGQWDSAMLGPGTLDEASRRRSIYFTVKRSKLVPAMQLFDGPDTLTSLGQRAQTTTGPQALFFLNDPAVRSAAVTLAQSLLQADAQPESLVQGAYERILSRTPTPAELERARAFLDQEFTTSDTDPKRRESILADLVQVLFGLNEFIYLE